MKLVENLRERPLTNVLGEAIRDSRGQTQAISMVRFLAGLVGDETFTRGLDYVSAVRKAATLGELLRTGQGDHIEIEDEDHARFVRTLRAPSSNINTALLAAHAPFVEAILAAKDATAVEAEAQHVAAE